MAEEKPKGVILFYLMGSLGTALFLFFLSSTLGSLFSSEPLYLPALASQLSLENAVAIDEFLTTTPLPVPTTLSRLLLSTPFLAILAMLSIGFFNFSKSSLVLTSVLSLLSLLSLFIISSLLLSITLFASHSITSAFLSFTIFFLFLAPFFFIARLTLLLGRSPKLWHLATYYNSRKEWYQQWPVSISALVLMIIYLLLRHLVAFIDTHSYTQYLHLFIAALNSLNIDQPSITISDFNHSLWLYQLVGHVTTIILMLCLVFIIVKRSRAAVIIAFFLIISNTARLLLFAPFVQQSLTMINNSANLYITLIQIVLFSLVVNTATLFFLIKKYDRTLVKWQTIK